MATRHHSSPPPASSPLRRSVRRIRRGVAAGAAGLLLLLAVSALLIARSEAQQRESLTARFDSRQATAARFIEAYVGELFQQEAALGTRLFAGATDPAAFAEAAANQGFDAALLLDSSGRLLASLPDDPGAVGRDLTGRYPHLRTAVRGAPAVSGVVTSAGRREQVVAFAVPFGTPTGRRVFSGAYAVEATPLGPFIRNAIPFRSGRVLVIDEQDRVVAGSGTGEPGRRLAAVAPTLASLSTRSAYLGSGARQQYATQSPVQGTTWSLLFAVDTDELLGPISTGARWAPRLALGGAGLLGLLALTAFYRYLLQSVRLRESEARQRAILDAAGDPFVGMDGDGRVIQWNAAATRLLGWSETEALGQLMAELVVPPERRKAHTAGLARFLSTGQTSLPTTPVRLQALKKDGTRADVEFSVSRLPWESGWHFHAFLRDISEQLEHDRQLRHLALTDGLTGLLNRRSILERLDQAVARAKRRSVPVAVLFIDVDEFKAVNDRYGHAAGDAVLVAIGNRLRGLFRAEDSLARLGGDEFLVVCEDLDSPAEAQALAERTRLTLARPYDLDGPDLDGPDLDGHDLDGPDVRGRSLNVTASVGLAVADGSVPAHILLARADAQMYDVKAASRAFTDIVLPRDH